MKIYLHLLVAFNLLTLSSFKQLPATDFVSNSRYYSCSHSRPHSRFYSRPYSCLYSCSKWTGYVFVIDLDKRKSAAEVQQPANWEFIGTDDKITVHCAPGKLQACQLIVDEKDTYVTASGARKLKPCVRIVANKANEFWYVSQFISTHNYTHRIFNEEDQAIAAK